MAEENFSRWLPWSVFRQPGDGSYSNTRTKHRTEYDLATSDCVITKYERRSRTCAVVSAKVSDISPLFIGFLPNVSVEFVLKSSITQLGVNAEDSTIVLHREDYSAEATFNLIAHSPLGVLALDYVGEGCVVGMLFAIDERRVVHDEQYVTRLLHAVNQKGHRLLVYGESTEPDWELKRIDGRVVAFLPVRKGTVVYNGEIHGLLPTIGSALRKGTKYKDLLRLHQEFRDGHTRVANSNGVLMVRGLPMHFCTLFGRIVPELLPPGLKVSSSRIIEPEESVHKNLLDRTFVFYGDSTQELTHVPIEFYTLESYREHVPFALRKTLAKRCSNVQDILRVFSTMPKDEKQACTYICKGGQFAELTDKDWVVADPAPMENVSYENPEEQQEKAQEYAREQCEYGILSAVSMDDITSDGVLFTRYFLSPCLKSLILSRAVGKKLRAVFFSKASRFHGSFFSQEDSSLLGDLNVFGISVFFVDESKGEIFQFIRRAGRDAGVFVPLDQRRDYLQATFFGVYGSNLIAGDFEAELISLMSGVQALKSSGTHPLLNPSKPLALVTGGGPGAMEVGNRVAKSLGILSCGLFVDFGSLASKPGATINEQKKNPYVEAFMTYRPDKLVERQSDFNLDLPIFLTGGIGTDFEYALEEVRRKVGSVPPNPVILFGTPEHWGHKITPRYQENKRSGTIKGSEWISTIPWVVSTGKEALEVYTRFFNGTLPIGPDHPPNDRGFLVAAEEFGM